MKLQQGDVILKNADIPKDAKAAGHLTLASGEATGHHHTMTAGDCELYEKDDILYLRVGEAGGTLTHQEHDAVAVPPGDYVVRKVREWDAFDQEARNVQD